MNNRFCFFDLDGTLTDPAEGITNSFVHALEFFGLEIPDYRTLCSFIGPPLRTTFRETFGFPEEQTDVAVAKYREYFAEKGLFENRLYDGIPALLKKLRGEGRILVVATSKPEEFSVRILEHFGIADYFDRICGSLMDESRSDKAEVIKYALESEGINGNSGVMMIGDRKHDIIGAKKNGLYSCGVLYGYGGRQELESAGADFIAGTVENLEKILLG